MYGFFVKIYRLMKRAPVVSKDLSAILRNWPATDDAVDARIITGFDNQPMIQLRLHCGVLQMFLDGRPDGTKPHRCQMFLDYLMRRADALFPDDPEEPDDATLDRQDRAWAELDREITQFYHRRVALLAAARDAQDRHEQELAKSCYERAVRDSDYTLRAMEFVRDYSDDEDHIESHERFRPFVLWHRTVAMTQQEVLDKDFDEAIEHIKIGVGDIAKVYEEHGMSKWLKHDPSVAELRDMERDLRREHGIKFTLQEQLEEAVSREDYERAASIRDKLQARGRPFKAPRPTVRPI